MGAALKRKEKNLISNMEGFLEGLLGKHGLALAHCGSRILEAVVPGNNQQPEHPLRLPFRKNLAPLIRAEKP